MPIGGMGVVLRRRNLCACGLLRLCTATPATSRVNGKKRYMASVAQGDAIASIVYRWHGSSKNIHVDEGPAATVENGGSDAGVAHHCADDKRDRVDLVSTA